MGLDQVPQLNERAMANSKIGNHHTNNFQLKLLDLPDFSNKKSLRDPFPPRHSLACHFYELVVVIFVAVCSLVRKHLANEYIRTLA